MLRTSRGIGLLALALVGGVALASPDAARAFDGGAWDLATLKQTPAYTLGKKEGLVQELYYANEPLAGKPTRVFAYLGRPAEGNGPFPGMVLVHGGGGTAFPEWATMWAERGYVAIAMDLSGKGPNGETLADGGPDQDTALKFSNLSSDHLKDNWSYHAVAAVLRAHSLLASLPEVDPTRVGLTGISWGGYLTSLVAGLDDRFKVAVPVYGCGFYEGGPRWQQAMSRMSDEERRLWTAEFDPSRFLPQAACPMLFVNGTNDEAYPLDIHQRSYQLVKSPVTLCIRVAMRHSHPEGWKPAEIGLFVDQALKGGPGLARIEPAEVVDGEAIARFTSPVAARSAELNYTLDTTSEWSKRPWKTVAATIEAGQVRAKLPAERPLIFFLNLTDERGALVSTPHATLAGE